MYCMIFPLEGSSIVQTHNNKRDERDDRDDDDRHEDDFDDDDDFVIENGYLRF